MFAVNIRLPVGGWGLGMEPNRAPRAHPTDVSATRRGGLRLEDEDAKLATGARAIVL